METHTNKEHSKVLPLHIHRYRYVLQSIALLEPRYVSVNKQDKACRAQRSEQQWTMASLNHNPIPIFLQLPIPPWNHLLQALVYSCLQYYPRKDLKIKQSSIHIVDCSIMSSK
jgi:hypothetical protein